MLKLSNQRKHNLLRYYGLLSLIGLLLFSPSAFSSSVPVPPNDSLVTGLVLGYAILNSRIEEIKPEQILHVLWLKIEEAQDIPGKPNFVERHLGEILRVLTKESLSPYLFGRRIKGHIQLAGDEHGKRYWISQVQIVKQP